MLLFSLSFLVPSFLTFRNILPWTPRYILSADDWLLLLLLLLLLKADSLVGSDGGRCRNLQSGK